MKPRQIAKKIVKDAQEENHRMKRELFLKMFCLETIGEILKSKTLTDGAKLYGIQAMVNLSRSLEF